MERTVLYLEGNAGVSGDMLLAALADLGFSLQKLESELAPFLPGLRVHSTAVWRGSLAARHLVADFPARPRAPRKLSALMKLVEGSGLPGPLKKRCSHVLTLLARAEKMAHQGGGQEPEVHEIGGWDTLMDVMGVVLGFHDLGVHDFRAGPLNLGGGTAIGDHGVLPVPAPAVSVLLKGFHVYSSGVKAELVTPTGAALVAALSQPVRTLPSMRLLKVGSGAGTRKLPFPNVLRLFLGTAAPESPPHEILKLECNVDDMNPQFWDHIFDRLYEGGALEAFVTPVLMKKSRPGLVLTVLSSPDHGKRLTEILFRETTTLGIRRELVSRLVLERKVVKVKTPFGTVPCKVGFQDGQVLNVAPEYEALKRLSQSKKISIKILYHAVLKEAPWPGASS